MIAGNDQGAGEARDRRAGQHQFVSAAGRSAHRHRRALATRVDQGIG